MKTRAHQLICLFLLTTTLGCGKSLFPKIDLGGPCELDEDCVSGLCELGICVPLPGSDGGTDGGTDGGNLGPFCVIAGQQYANGTVNPANPCQLCLVAVNPNDWSNVDDGTTCPGDRICDDGVCEDKCVIGGTAVARGDTNPDNPCEACNPDVSRDAWTPLPDGTTGEQCICVDNGSCFNGCLIDGQRRLPNERNPANECEMCDTSRSRTQWSYACYDYDLPYVPRNAEGTSASMILQDARPPGVLNKASNKVWLWYRNPDGSFINPQAEQYTFAPAGQYIITVDPTVVMPAGVPGLPVRSVARTTDGHASARIRSLHELQIVTYLRSPVPASNPTGSVLHTGDASGYVAPSTRHTGPKLYSPHVTYLKDGRWTSFTVMNASDRPVQVSLTFVNDKGEKVAGPFNPVADNGTVAAWGTVLVDQTTQLVGLPESFQGGVIIESQPESALIAVVNERGPNGSSALATWLATAQPYTQAVLPLLANVARGDSGTATDVAIINASGLENSVKVRFNERDPNQAPNEAVAVHDFGGPRGPWATGYLFGDEVFTQNLLVQWARLTATQPAVGLVLENSQKANNLQNATAWEALTPDQSASRLYLPMYLANNGLNTISKRTATTRVQLTNFGNRDSRVSVYYRDPLGLVSLGVDGLTVARSATVDLPMPTYPVSYPFFGSVEVIGESDSKLRAVVRIEEQGLVGALDQTISVWSYTVP